MRRYCRYQAVRGFNASDPMLENILEIQCASEMGTGISGNWPVGWVRRCTGPVLPRLNLMVHAMNLLVSVGTLVPWSVGVGVGVGVGVRRWGGVDVVWSGNQDRSRSGSSHGTAGRAASS